MYLLLKARRALNRHWAFSKKNPDCPTLVEMSNKTTTKVFAQQARGSRERFFVLRYYYYVDVRFRLRDVNVAGVTFSFTLRSRSGREAHRGSRFKDPGRHFPVPY